MHHIHHTQGLVIRSRNIGEANKMLTLYTRELGLVRVVVQGIRLNKSKLRFALQDYSYASVDLVRGRDIWRLTSATSISLFPDIRAHSKSFLLMARALALIERLCQGEEANERIFDSLVQSFYALDNPAVSAEAREALELYLILRIVYELGYIGESEMLSTYLEGDFTNEKMPELLRGRQSIILSINNALRESQL